MEDGIRMISVLRWKDFSELPEQDRPIIFLYWGNESGERSRLAKGVLSAWQEQGRDPDNNIWMRNQPIVVEIAPVYKYLNYYKWYIQTYPFETPVTDKTFVGTAWAWMYEDELGYLKIPSGMSVFRIDVLNPPGFELSVTSEPEGEFPS